MIHRLQHISDLPSSLQPPFLDPVDQKAARFLQDVRQEWEIPESQYPLSVLLFSTFPQILGYNGIDKGSYIKYGCAEIPKSWFTDTRNRVPIEIKFDSNKILNKEQIEAIIKYCAVNK